MHRSERSLLLLMSGFGRMWRTNSDIEHLNYLLTLAIFALWLKYAAAYVSAWC